MDARDEASLLAMRQRLLLSLGLLALAAPGCSGPWGSCEPDVRTSTFTLAELAAAETADTGLPEACPPGEDVPYTLLACSTFEVVPAGTTQDGCRYQYECYQCCGYGRPYLDVAGIPVTSAVTEDDAWLDAPAGPDVGLTEAERQQIGEHWLENAVAEHSSVAGFHRFALDLLAHGAPPELVLRAQEAATQEVRHTIDCFSLASRYLGRPCGPAPLQLGTNAPIARSLAELAAWTARDGAIGETVAALLAARCLEDATDPGVRTALERIVRDETAHAELAWDTLRWALDVGGPEVADAIRGAFAAIAPPRGEGAPTAIALVRHGVPDRPAHAELTAACIERVLRPVASALLA